MGPMPRRMPGPSPFPFEHMAWGLVLLLSPFFFLAPEEARVAPNTPLLWGTPVADYRLPHNAPDKPCTTLSKPAWEGALRKCRKPSGTCLGPRPGG
jgi:hypothetical protein